MKRSNDPAVARLVESSDPSVRYLTLTEVLREPRRAPYVSAARRAIPEGHKVRRLLAGQKRDGGFGIHPYVKWIGGFWRLVALAELGMPSGDRRIRALADRVLRWVEGERGAMEPVMIQGRVRAHATQDGYVLAALSLLGLAKSARMKRLAERIIEWQWPDGGWNCDRKPEATHSSFHETHGPLWGLAEFHRVTGDPDARRAAQKAAEFILRHHVFLSESSKRVIREEWLRLHFPPYWHYDALQGLWVLSRAGKLDDPRAKVALDLLVAKRRADGMWHAGGYHWKPPGSTGSNVELVDWGRGGPQRMGDSSRASCACVSVPLSLMVTGSQGPVRDSRHSAASPSDSLSPSAARRRSDPPPGSARGYARRLPARSQQRLAG